MNKQDEIKFTKEIGMRLKGIRIRLKLSQSMVAKDFGTTQSSLSQMENGVRFWSAAEIARLTEYYNASFDEVLASTPARVGKGECSKESSMYQAIDLLEATMKTLLSNEVSYSCEEYINIAVYKLLRHLLSCNEIAQKQGGFSGSSEIYDVLCSRCFELAPIQLESYIKASRINTKLIHCPVEHSNELRAFVQSTEKLLDTLNGLSD